MQLLVQDKRTKFLFYFPIVKVTRSLLGSNQDIVTSREIGFVESKILPDEPLDLIPDDRISRLPTDRDPQPRNAQPVPGEDDLEMGCFLPSTHPI